MPTHILAIGALSFTDAGQSGLKSLAIGLAGGLGAIGAGVGIGLIFAKALSR